MIARFGLGLRDAAERPAAGPDIVLHVQTVSYAQEGTLNKFLVDGRVVRSDVLTRAVLASAEIVQFFRRLERREGVTAASAAVQEDGVHGPG